MNKFYYGMWQNWYKVDWPTRFLVELIFAALLLLLLKWLVKPLKLKPLIIKGCVLAGTECIYLFSRNSEFGIKADRRIIEWGNRQLEKKKSKFLLLSGVIITLIYVSAIAVDDIKFFFQKGESFLSEGYEEYPPLFTKIEEKDKEAETEVIVEEKQEDIYILLNKKGAGGANIRREPSLNGTIISGADRESELLYLNKWSHDGERYWIKVYLPKDDVEGWISGKLVEAEQLQELIKEK